ncbi:MAG: hypothetical protein GEV11_07125 [Streptosporangiales bacterium]|nr:hypothetical protein [Streptosporangiales bacterium]
MFRSRRSSGLLAAAAGGIILSTLTAPAAAQATTGQAITGQAITQAGCLSDALPITVEESRLTTPTVPGAESASRQFLEAGGFTGLADGFVRRLCQAPSVRAAHRLAVTHAENLWRTAVDRAQGRRQMGTIDRYDDRPRYWAHLSATAALRRWKPSFPVGDADRARLVRDFDRHSRGLEDTAFSRGRGVTRLLVSGFDPYQLRNEPRRSNPSGAAALQLDGRRFSTDKGLVEVQTVMLPVTWSGFDAGIVEDAFGPHLRKGDVDLIMTVSQGGRATMNIEQWAGRWRGGAADNNEEGTPEVVPGNDAWPMPDPPREFIETTLPHQAMVDAGTGPWPVRLNPRICEWPPGTFPDPAAVVCHENGPTPGGRARSGGGGDYLSNESMYRSNRLRLGLGLTDLPGGHLHISALVYPSDPAVLIDDAFRSDRRATVDQTVALVRATGLAVR